jgi:hypothetical protein
MKGLNRWIILAVIVLASIAVAVDHVTYHRPEPEAQGGLPLPDLDAEAGGYGTVYDDTEVE